MEQKRIDVKIIYKGNLLRGNYLKETEKSILTDLYYAPGYPDGLTVWIPKKFLTHSLAHSIFAETWEGKLPVWFNFRLHGKII